MNLHGLWKCWKEKSEKTHGDDGLMILNTAIHWTGLPVADFVQSAKDRNMWRSLVSVSVTADPQTPGRTKTRQGIIMQTHVHERTAW